MGPTLFVFCGGKDNTKFIIRNLENDFFGAHTEVLVNISYICTNCGLATADF